MLTMKWLNFPHVFLLGLLLCLLGTATPAAAQTDAVVVPDTLYPPLLQRDLRLSVLGGICFDSEHPEARCWILMTKLQLYRRPRIRSGREFSSFGQSAFWGSSGPLSVANGGSGTALSGEIGVTMQQTDMWPPPDDPIQQATPVQSAKAGLVEEVAQEAVPEVDHLTVASTLDFVLPLQIEPRFLLELIAGGGAARIFERKQTGGNFVLRNDWMPVFTYGIGITAHGKGSLKNIDFLVQYRTIIYLPNTLKYKGPDNTRITMHNISTVDTSNLFIGVSIGL